MLLRAGAEEEAALTVDLDLGSIESARIGWPFLRDRRIDAYAGLQARLLDTD